MNDGHNPVESGSDSIPEQPQDNQEAREASSDAVSPPLSLEGGDDGGCSQTPVDSEEPAQKAAASPCANESSDMDIPEDIKTWVDKQIPKYKTGAGIMCRAKNRKKDLDTVQRYVDELVAKGTIPASGKKAPGKKASRGNAESGAPTPSSSLLSPVIKVPKEVVEVPISEIHMNAQIRKDDLNEANVLRIMESFDTSDPVDLFKRPEGELELANGYHRVESATRLGKTTIRAYIHEGTMCDALMFAYRTNDRNGIPLTKADRMNALIMIRKTPEGAKFTGDQLADQLGVSRQTIQTYLGEIRSGKSGDPKKRASTDKTDLQRKAVETLTKLEGRFGLVVFRDFVKGLDDSKRATLRAMLGAAK